MGASEFFTVSLGRNPHEAFDKARKEAQYLYGHGGYTGTIAEKGEFKYLGEIGTAHWQKLPEWYERAHAKRDRESPKERLPGKPIPAKYRELIEKTVDIYDDKWGPAVCFQVTGSIVPTIKAELGRKGTMDKVYVFCGWARS